MGVGGTDRNSDRQTGAFGDEMASGATEPADGIDAVTALLDASRRYAAHVRLLVDQLALAHLVGRRPIRTC